MSKTNPLPANIAEAKAEAKRFLSRVEAYERSLADTPSIWSSKEHAAVKRSSMDLSRALTAVRHTR